MRVSDNYAHLNAEMHKAMPEYGAGGHRHADIVRQLMDGYQTRDVLDYGCGKQTLADALGMGVRGYDPCIPGLNLDPWPADIVVCTDVLEHVEPDCLESVLRHLAELTRKVCFCVISVAPSLKYLSDGRNTHLCLMRPTEWLKRLMGHFEVQQFAKSPNATEFMVTLQPRGEEQKVMDFVVQEVAKKHRFVVQEDGTLKREDRA